ncbi:MAG: glycosyltransferase [Pseudomonadota bacterium]
MIFATTGTQLVFPRLMAALEALAPELGEPIIAQAGPEAGAAEAYPHLDIRAHLAPAEYDRIVTEARVIVAHAGIGTILTARRHGKPLILVPRRLDQGEHRNDHQLATARQVAALPGIHVAWEMDALAPFLARPDLPAASEDDARGHRAALTGFMRGWIADQR